MLTEVKQRYPTFKHCSAAYSASLQPLLLSDLEKAYSEKSLTLSDLDSVYGSNSSVLWLKTQLLGLDFASSQKEGADLENLSEFSRLFIRQYPHLKLTEILLFVARFKLGRYGRFYGYFDTLTVGEAFRRFLRERGDELEILIRRRNNEAVEHRYQTAVEHHPVMSDYLRQRLAPYLKPEKGGDEV